MDQADSLRNLFAKREAKDKLIDCRNKLYEAILVGNHDNIDFFMAELDQAQRHFEECINKEKT
ncbi:hypothetical protein [Photobacterium rosenbergii]|uniref:Lacal_2735 family protein n=1 Tax=Photobacterium rosenbergii TaxID=294936 RepID=A0ABU3ZBA7_9GAMM|nr:hypothetical protein [Photobacterium rosenbergii]MDV5167392.1 hypothetical protein [Photobacterium rosenbergii]